MFRSLLLLSAAFALAVQAITPPAPPSQDPVPVPTSPDTKNPLKPTPELMAKAKKVYGYDCEMCHGATGDGKTDLAKDMKLTLSDLSDPKTLEGKSDAELFDLIKNGKGPMTPEANRMKTDDIWNLVQYARSLAKHG